MTASPAPAAPPTARSTAQLLTDRTFGPWFWGNAVSNSGNWLFNVTASIVVFQLSRSALLVGLVSVAQFAPLVAVSPFAGALSDRVDRRRLLLVAQTCSAFAATVLAVVVVTRGAAGLPGAWPILLTAFGIGIGQAVASPALQALVPSLVSDTDLESGVSLTSLTFNLGRAVGPATAAILLATAGVEAAFVVNAASFLVLIVALATIHPRPRDVDTSGGDRSVRAGLRHVRGDRVTLLLLLGAGAVGFAADPMITLTPSLADTVGGGETLVAVMVTAFGAAAAPTAAVSGRLQRSRGSLRVAAMGTAVAAGGLVVVALGPVAWVMVLGCAITGAGLVLGLTGFTAALHRRVPDELRGRVMALWAIAFLGTRPVAAVVDGGAADLVGPRIAVVVAIGVALTGTGIAVRLQRRPDERLGGAT